MQNKSSSENPNPNPSSNPDLDKPAMTSRFLRSLAQINLTMPSSSTAQRSRRIRRAAYASMAQAAGGRRAWSRAMLRRLGRLPRPRPPGQRSFVVARRIRVSGLREPNRAEALRRLVPGGKGMDFCGLLEETASYMQCLAAQVGLMQRVVDSISE